MVELPNCMDHLLDHTDGNRSWDHWRRTLCCLDHDGQDDQSHREMPLKSWPASCVSCGVAPLGCVCTLVGSCGAVPSDRYMTTASLLRHAMVWSSYCHGANCLLSPNHLCLASSVVRRQCFCGGGLPKGSGLGVVKHRILWRPSMTAS